MGDFNCSIHGNEAVQCLKAGYKSSYHDLKPNDEIITHYTHQNKSIGCDFIFYKNCKNPFAYIKPVDTFLFPKQLNETQWPSQNEWNLSDHRPLTTAFEIIESEYNDEKQ